MAGGKNFLNRLKYAEFHNRAEGSGETWGSKDSFKRLTWGNRAHSGVGPWQIYFSLQVISRYFVFSLFALLQGVQTILKRSPAPQTPAQADKKSHPNHKDNDDNNEKQLPLIKTLPWCQTQC